MWQRFSVVETHGSTNSHNPRLAALKYKSLYWTTNSRRNKALAVQIKAFYISKKRTLDCFGIFARRQEIVPVWLEVESSQIPPSEALCCYFKRGIDASRPLQAAG